MRPSLIVLVSALGVVGSARAQSAAAGVEWTGPVGCPDDVHVRDRVMSYMTDGSRALGKTARLSASRAGDQWRVVIVTDIDGQRGEREVAGPSCDNVADAAALIVAMAFDAAPAVATPPHTTPPGVPPPQRDDVETPFVTAARVAPAPPRWFLGAEVAGDVGTLPGAAVGVGGVLLLRHGYAGARVELVHLFARDTDASVTPTAGGSISLTAATGEVCTGDRLALAGVVACAGARVGRLHGVGFGVRNPDADSALHVAVTVGLGRFWPVDPQFGVWTAAGVGIPLTRTTFRFDDLGDIYQPGDVAARLSIAAEVRFW